jgi:methyl-accepting chemotaxis protein
MTEMASRTKTNAENANQANTLVDQARSAAEKGNNNMGQMITAMSEINESGQSISNIIRMIDEIAFQTNLLALNATVKAARAGKHGKGFAVVAEEVGNLAASAKAARETAELVEGSAEKTEKGTEIANQTATALQDIFTGVTKVTDIVAEIANASNEQALGIARMNSGLNQIGEVTLRNTAAAERSAAAAEELSVEAKQMRDMLTLYRETSKQSYTAHGMR